MCGSGYLQVNSVFAIFDSVKRFWIILLCALSLGACNKPQDGDGTDPGEETLTTWRYANVFARNAMNLYYLWQKEIESGIDAWKETEDPIAKVREIRYKDAAGKDIDRWTMMTDDYAGFFNSVSGNGKTSGFDFLFYYADKDRTSLVAVVTYTYKDSPARAAGLKRGDVIFKVNGESIPYPGYESAYAALTGGDPLSIELTDGRKLTLTPREMYEDPVHLAKVFDCGGVRVGYLHFTSFTLDACEDLVDVCKDFKKQGVSRLILDLRYNGGGFSVTEEVLASMLAPEADVAAGNILATEVFNDKLTAYYAEKKYDTNTYFRTDFLFSSGNRKYEFSTAGANLGIDRLYAIISSGSASASEALLCDLFPYLDITLVGAQSHGKYCSGLIMDAEGFYDDYADQLGEEIADNGKKYAANWGLYVMYSRFADKNGETRCMPDGLAPDIEVADDPLDGRDLGDPEETMLASVLKLCGYKDVAPSARQAPSRLPAFEPAPVNVRALRPEFGHRIILPSRPVPLTF